MEDLEYDFSSDYDDIVNSDEDDYYEEDPDDSDDDETTKELNFDEDDEDSADEDDDSDDDSDVDDAINEDPLETPQQDEYSDSEDDFDDVEDDIYAHKPILDEEIIRNILEARLFAYSTKDKRRVSLDKADWATIARLADIGMDRIFVNGKEVFVSGFNKISLKTEKNISIVAEQMKSRGLHDYAKKVEQLRC